LGDDGLCRVAGFGHPFGRNRIKRQCPKYGGGDYT
jgi:hypothetical protein